MIKNIVKNNAIPLTIFITGACVLIIEVVAVRFLSPFYGNTIFTVSGVLSVILGALSLGYYFGGKLADYNPSIKIFYGIICLSGLLLLFLYLSGIVLLPLIVPMINFFMGPIYISVLLFAWPAFLLGALSPYALKIQIEMSQNQGVGGIAGKIFFLSTVGSIIGSLSAGFVLIPNFGIDQIFVGVGTVLFLLGFVPLVVMRMFGDRSSERTAVRRKSDPKSSSQSVGLLRDHLQTFLLCAFFLFALQIFLAEQVLFNKPSGAVYMKDGLYEKISIFEGVYKGRSTRFFMQDKSASGAMFLDTDDPTDMVYDYTKYYSVYKVFNPDIKKALVIGSGAYTIPKALLSDLPSISSTAKSPSSENSSDIPSTTKSPNTENSPYTSTRNTANTIDISIIPDDSNTYDISNTANNPDATNTLNIMNISDTSNIDNNFDKINTSDISNTPDSPNTPNLGNISDTPNISDIPMTTDTTDTTDTADNTNTPNALNNSNNPNTSNIPNTPDELNTSDIPNTPVEYNNSDSSDNPNTPNNPNTQIDVVDIEPSLQELSQKYFNLTNDPRLNSYTMDGRRFLNETDNSYDLIFSDVYYSLLSIPSHFTTQEFFDLAKTKLSPNGVFVANLIGDLSREPDSFILAQIKTFKSVFPNSYFIATESPNSDKVQNIIFIGINGDQKYDLDDESIINHSDEVIRSLGSKNIDLQRFELSNYPIFTDNYAPADYFTIQTLKRDSNPNSVTDGKKALNLIAQQIRYGPRYIGSEGHKLVQDFIIAESKAYADQVYTQSWDYLDAKNNTHELKNIIARINPDSQNRIILGTHYDSKKFANLDSKNKNEPVPGANDSASGTAVLLTLMQKIAISKPELNFGIDFIFFDGEEGDPNIDDPKAEDSKINNSKEIKSTIEWSPIGSTYFADSLINTVETSTNQQLTLIKDSKYAQYEQIPYEINITDLYGKEIPDSAIVVDMVCDKDLQIYKENSSVQNAPNLIESFWQTATKIAPNVFVNEIRNEIQDDHTSLNKIGIPSILLIDFEYPYFHTTKDTLDKCSDRSLETIVDVMYEYLISRK